MRCSFCATGKGGFARNLKAHEIMDQVMTVQEEFGSRVSNIGRDCIHICLTHVVSRQAIPVVYALTEPQCDCMSVLAYMHMQPVDGQV